MCARRLTRSRECGPAGTLASHADPLALYEEAVQSCANEIRYLEKFYREAEPALRYGHCPTLPF